MFGDERLGIQRRQAQGRQRPGITDIAQGHAHIAQQPAAFGAQQGRARESRLEGRVVELEPFDEVRPGEVGAMVCSQDGSLSGEAVPGTGGQAIVAAKDAVTDGRTQILRDGTAVFDGEVRDAPTGIQREGRRQCTGGASAQAAGAGPATVVLGRIGFQFGRRQDLCQEEPIAQAPRDEVGVLADKANARALGEIAFQDGPRVDIPE